MAERDVKNVVVCHYDVHGVVCGTLLYHQLNAAEAFTGFPECSPEQVVSTIQNRYAAAPTKLRISLIDIPIDLKNPVAFCDGLNDFSKLHFVVYYDHHETSLPHLKFLRKAIRTYFIGPSAYQLCKYVMPESGEPWETLAIVGAVGDRDSSIASKIDEDIRLYADGLDVMVRQNANMVLQNLIADSERTLEEAKTRGAEIPTAPLEQTIGLVVVARGQLPAQWGPKSLEKLAFQENTDFATGYQFDERNNIWIVRAIVRWDRALNYQFTPRDIAAKLWPTRSIIGHPAAPTVAANSEAEAAEMAAQWAKAISDEVGVTITRMDPQTVMAQVLLSLHQILQRQEQQYKEYLELKKRQVELLERGSGSAAD